MILIGIVIVVATFWAIVKNYEARFVLFISGTSMAIIGGQVTPALDVFVKSLTNEGLVPVICTVMGFSYVMDYTKCSKHLVVFMTSLLKNVKFILIPGSVMITFVLGIALPTAAGLSAAVGAILIPTLIGNGVHPTIAGSAVLLGSFGVSMSPGLMFNPQVAELSGKDIMTVIASFMPQIFAGAIVAAIILTIIAKVRNEGVDSQKIEKDMQDENFKVNFVKAIIPLVPLIILVLGSKEVAIIPEISVPISMIIGTVLGFIICRADSKEFTKTFFKGTGNAFCDIVGLIAAAAMFTKGMQIIGLTGALIEVMKNSQSIAKVASAFGPFIIAVLSGSGNAAALAFNGAVTPHAEQFGLTIMGMGSMAQIAGSLGRCMSPVAGCAIICAQMAGVSPIELVKRNMIPSIIATLLILFTLL